MNFKPLMAMTAPFQSIELSDAPHRRGVFMQSAHELFLGGDIKALWFNIESFWSLREGQCLSAREICPRIFFESVPNGERTQKRPHRPECKAEWSNWLRGGSASGILRSLLLEIILRRKSSEVGEPGRERKLGGPRILEKAKARQGSRRVEEIPRMATRMN
jgi:hypothetical protein